MTIRSTNVHMTNSGELAYRYLLNGCDGLNETAGNAGQKID